MLKIWKKTRKEKESDTPSNSQSVQDTKQEDTTSTPSSSFLPVAPPGHAGTKRPRSGIELEIAMTESTERPTKISKISNAPLRHHLPEVLNVDESLTPLPISILISKALEQAKRENTIIVLPLLKPAIDLVVRFLAWAIEAERIQADLDKSQRRSAIVVVDDDDVLQHYASMLQTGMPGTSIAKYTQQNCIPQWDAQLDLLREEVVLMTSHLLLKSLIKGMVKITQIHSLILGDAKRVRNQDSHLSIPIVQVMDDYYRSADLMSCPRVLGVIAPSAVRWSYFDSRMLRLEQTLAAKVCGVAETKRAEILALPDCPNEMTILYDAPDMGETSLFRQLRQLSAIASIFRRHFKTSRYAQSELGSCASDLIWRRALKEMESSIPAGYSSDDDNEGQIMSTAKAASRMCSVVKNWVFSMPNLDLSSRGFNVSHKFLRLVQVLESFEPYRDEFRGIIFVQRRSIALVMADLLRTLGQQLRFLRPYTVIAHGPTADLNHQEIFNNFATGTYNLLIATKFMEDLDAPKASVVIRYNLFESQVSHAYVRARSRGRESHLVHMVERDNDAHRNILSKITKLDTAMLHWTEAVCSTPRSAIPPRTLHETIISYHSESEEEDDEQIGEFIRDPITSGRIGIQDATTVFYRFAAATAPQMVAEGTQPLFAFEDMYDEGGTACAYICRILLPGTLIDETSGSPSPSKAEARRSACFRACKKLSQAGLLDYRLFPLPSSLLARRDYDHKILMNDDADANDQKFTGSRSYPRKQPDFWKNVGPLPIKILYPMVVYIGQGKDGMQSRAPMVLLTRQPLPALASFRVFFSGAHEVVQFQRGAVFSVNEARLTDIYNYTIRVCRALMNRPFTCPLDEMAYFFAPLPLDWTMPKDLGLEHPDIMNQVPWKQVSVAAAAWAIPLTPGSSDDIASELVDSVIQDRWVEFTRRYNYVRLRTDMTPLSKPTDSPREAGFDSLFAFCQARLKGFEGLKDYQQPIIEVAQLPTVINNLNPTSMPVGSSSKLLVKYLIPELCAKFTLPASILRTATLLPSIIRRIDGLLVVKELNAKFFDHTIREDLLHMAICAPSAGMEYDYERLELLGDAFLKYLSTVYVSVTNPTESQHSLHIGRQNIISNRALLISSTRVGLPSYIQSKVFHPKSWQPPNFRIQPPPRSSKTGQAELLGHRLVPDADAPSARQKQKGIQTESLNEHQSNPGSALVQTDLQPNCPKKNSSPRDGAHKSDSDADEAQMKKRKKRKRHNREDDSIQWLGDKAVADVAEAIIGAAYISGGRETALQVTKALTISMSNIDRWSDLGRKVLAPPPEITAKLRPGSIKSVEGIIGHKFHRPHLLAQALTHSSIEGHEMTSYERLEFIGDAILDFMVVRYIFDRDQQLSPGALTLLKSAMVSNSTLAAVCVWSGLQKHLLLESYNVSRSIEEYAHALSASHDREYEVAEKEGRPPGQYWNELRPPKALSDVVESVIGAIYISDKFSPTGTEAFFDNVLKPFYDQHITFKSLSYHPTKLLYELFQAQGCHQLDITKERFEDMACCYIVVHDIILASAEAPTSVSAARCASVFALDALEGDADFLRRTCDCRTQTAGKKSKNSIAFEQVMSNLREDVEGDGLHHQSEENS